MKKKVSYAILVGSLVPIIIGAILFEKTNYIIPATFLIVSVVMVANFMETHRKIMNGEFITVGRKNKPIAESLFWLSVGITWVVLLFFVNHSTNDWFSSNTKIVICLFSLLKASLSYSTYEILLRDDSIYLNANWNERFLKLSNIQKVVFNKREVTIIKKKSWTKYTFEEEDILKLKHYFQDKMNEKVVVE